MSAAVPTRSADTRAPRRRSLSPPASQRKQRDVPACATPSPDLFASLLGTQATATRWACGLPSTVACPPISAVYPGTWIRAGGVTPSWVTGTSGSFRPSPRRAGGQTPSATTAPEVIVHVQKEINAAMDQLAASITTAA